MTVGTHVVPCSYVHMHLYMYVCMDSGMHLFKYRAVFKSQNFSTFENYCEAISDMKSVEVAITIGIMIIMLQL